MRGRVETAAWRPNRGSGAAVFQIQPLAETKLRFKLVLVVFFLVCTGLILTRLRIQTFPDPPSGVWTGDWGTTPSHRNAVTVNMEWDGGTLIGTVNPGPHGVRFTKASFDAVKGAVHLELQLEIPSTGRRFHYFIDGTVEGRTLIGTWYNEDNKGNFRLKRR